MIFIKDLEYSYKSGFKLSIDELNIGSGLTGILGKNGAGKTTFLSLVSTTLRNRKGIIKINDTLVEPKNYFAIRKEINYLPQFFDFFSGFTVLEIMRYFAALQKIDSTNVKKAIDDSLKTVNLEEYLQYKANKLSGGLKRRLGIAVSILNNPKILILDEPTAGVDPQERIELRNFVKRYSLTNDVLLSTHIVEDIETICENLIVILGGKVVYSGKLQNFVDISPDVYEIECKNEEIDKYKDVGVITNMFYTDNNTCKITLVSNEKLNYPKVSKSLESSYLYIQGDRHESNS